jgi:hypothetical protein
MQTGTEPTAVPTAEPVLTVEPTVVPTLPPVPAEITIPPVVEEVSPTAPVPETQSSSDSSSEEDELTAGDQKIEEQPEDQLSQDGNINTTKEASDVH